MKRSFVVGLFLVAAAVAPVCASAQGARGSGWAALDELPDWAGLWEVTRAPGVRNEEPALTSEYQARLDDYRAAQQSGKIQDTPAANCVPSGMPGIMTQPYPIEILFSPGKVTILIEAYSQWRQIFTDGRRHPEDPDLTFNGHSIGHWEGDTLVVDTVGFTTATAIGGSFGIKHSENMHIVERLRLVGPDTLEIVTKVEDPDALAKPWTTTRVYSRHRDWTLAEYICQENNRNFFTDEGKAGIDLEFEGHE
jgi:hypothetical protein